MKETFPQKFGLYLDNKNKFYFMITNDEIKMASKFKCMRIKIGMNIMLINTCKKKLLIKSTVYLGNENWIFMQILYHIYWR